MIHEVVVAGGGASGMMAAITAAGRGKKVTILEHMDRLGKKILMTGNGRCNYSNINQNISCYRTSDKGFVEDVLNKFSQREATEFFKQNGIVTKNRNGYLYPNSGQASVINDILRIKCENLGINIMYNTECISVKKDNGFFRLKCTNKENGRQNEIKAGSLIISTGGKSYSKTGSDGSGYTILKRLGHNIVKPLPALTSLHCSEKFFKSLKGVRCDGKVILYVEGRYAAEDKGEIQLTDYGISGIPVFQVSRYASIALDKKKKVTAVIDFLPDMEADEVKKLLQNDNSFTLEQKLNGMINKKLSAVLLKYNLDEIIKNLKSMKVNVTATGGFEQSQVCTGGVNVNEICSTTMESKIVKNLFITGEVIDVDGVCGGYNLQWAWSTGFIAGSNC